MDFVVDQKWYKEMLRAVYGHQHTKYGEDNSNSGGVMDIFFFQNGGRPPSWILLHFKNDITAHCGLSISTIVPNLVTITQTAAKLLRFSVFQIGSWLHFIFRPPTKSTWRPEAMFKILRQSDLYFRRYCDFSFQKFGLKCLFRPKNWVFWGISLPKHFGLSSRPPKGTSLRGTAHFWRIDRQNRSTVATCRRGEETRKKRKVSHKQWYFMHAPRPPM